MTTKSTQIACPKCGRTEGVSYTEIRRVQIFHIGAEIEEVEASENMTSGTLLHSGCLETREEVIDSMGNEEYMECVTCGARWDVPEVDDIFLSE